MRTHFRTRRARMLLVSALTGLLVALGGTVSLGSSAAAGDWVDGGDDLPCVDDVTCEWIEGCYLDDNGKPVYPGQAPKPTPTPTPTPTAPQSSAPPAKPTKPVTPTKPAGGSGSGSSSSGSGSSGNGTTGSPAGGGTSTGGGTGSDDGAVDPALNEADATETTETTETEDAENPYADRLAPPVLKVKGADVVVRWEAPAVEGFEVAEYVVELNGAEPATVDAGTLKHVFTDVAPGAHRALVTAVSTTGEELKSFKSQNALVGDPTGAPTVAVTGDLVPGATVTVLGTGFAPRTKGLVVEIHSTPRELATVRSGRDGTFEAEVVLPADLPEGEHTVVVLDGTEQVAALPVSVAAAAADLGAEEVAAASATVAGDWSRGGIVLLLALAGAGALALLWHGATSRRRRHRPLTVSVPGPDPVTEVLTAH